jgi:hypothetical protein
MSGMHLDWYDLICITNYLIKFFCSLLSEWESLDECAFTHGRILWMLPSYK